ncbi:O-methyltransferase [Marinomonas sp.]|uniref:O-methyltransferase n=1 Tax=Marinomonas sp. TaxID=1904862 RepID=UPI003A8EA011
MNFYNYIEIMERKGLVNDYKETVKDNKYLNITKDTGAFLDMMVCIIKPRKVLEIGTSNGYSTLWLAKNLPEKGKLITIEKQSNKAKESMSNIKKVGFEDKVTVVVGTAQKYLVSNNEMFDMIFIDANRLEYLDYYDSLIASLRCGGLLVCDNAISHEEELKPFTCMVGEDTRLLSFTLNVGKGEFLVYKY